MDAGTYGWNSDVGPDFTPYSVGSVLDEVDASCRAVRKSAGSGRKG